HDLVEGDRGAEVRGGDAVDRVGGGHVPAGDSQQGQVLPAALAGGRPGPGDGQRPVPIGADRGPQRPGRPLEPHPGRHDQRRAGRIRPYGQVHHLPRFGGVQRRLDRGGRVFTPGRVGAVPGGVEPVAGRGGDRRGERVEHHTRVTIPRFHTTVWRPR